MVWHSRDWPLPPSLGGRPRPPSVPDGTVGPTGVDAIGPDGVRRLAPPADVPEPRPGVEEFDPHDRVRYRVVRELSPAEGWVTAATMLDWFQCPFNRVLDWARRGLVEVAQERGSPTRRYRVMDPTRCMAEARRPVRQSRNARRA